MSFFRLFFQATSFALLLVATGCCTHGRHHLICNDCDDIIPGAIPQPPGSHVYQWQEAQEQLAERADYVVYQNEWLGESEELSPFGVRHVASLLQQGPLFPIVVQASGNQSLDEERRIAMISHLESHNIDDASGSVVVGNATAEGLYGEEAPMLRQGFLRGSSRGGGFGNRGGTSGSQSGGGGFF